MKILLMDLDNMMSMKYIRTFGKPLIINDRIMIYYRYNNYYCYNIKDDEVKEILISNRKDYDFKDKDENKKTWYFKFKEEKK